MAGPSSTQNNFKDYFRIFKGELSLNYIESRYNMQVPLAAKALDGSVNDKYSEQFRSWDSIELKCLRKGCNKSIMSPYVLNEHNQKFHENDQQVECSLCPSSETFSFTNYLKHVINNHYGHLRYR